MCRFFPCLLAAVLAATLCLPARAQKMGPKETRALLRRAVNEGAFDQAVPLLQQLIEWFKDSKKASTKRDLEIWRFQLGLCQYLLGSFPASEAAFKEYLKLYRKGPHASEAAVYLADGYRFTGKFPAAVKQYKAAMAAYRYNDDWRTDILCSMVRCALAVDDWKTATPLLEKINRIAPDDRRANWAVTLLAVAYLKQGDLDKVYAAAPYLVSPDSVAARSVAYNLTALETGDALFGEERYRDALWVYRLVYPKAIIEKRSRRHLRDLRNDVEDLKEMRGMYRQLLRAQEEVGEAEAEIKNLEQVENYDNELYARIARSYMEIRRFREARVLFLYLRSILEPEQAEEPLYFAFHCSTQVKPWDKAFELGREYMEAYPAGTFYDTVSLTVGQMYAVQKKWPEVIRVLTKALEVSPKHENIAECMFLIGYASFMEERFPDAIKWLKDLNTKYPGNDRVEEATYWLGMSYLFNTNYREALRTFDDFLADFPQSSYREDATFRRAVCQYGLSEFRKSEKSLQAFVDAYPESQLLGEAWMMLADISGNFGELREAVKRYALALEHKLNIELYNYCNFRTAEMLQDLEDYEGIVRHFKAYIEENREGANLPLAFYWTAKAMWEMGNQREAMTCLLDAVTQYGRDRTALGIDMLLEEWVTRSKNLPPAVAKEAWKNLGALLLEARKKEGKPLVLRLEHIFLFNSNLSDKARKLITDRLLDPANIPEAPPTILEFILDEAPKHGKPELAVLAARTIVKDFPETDYVVAASMLLARKAIAEGDYHQAEKHLDVIRNVFATSPSAAKALIMLGNMYLKQRKYAAADACFKRVLGVRDWRGPLWPEAIYGRGECARLQRRYAKAAAYYERIYLLYSHYRSWTAKAYRQRAQCLLRLHEDSKAREVLAEFLNNKELADTPEAAEARKLMGRFERRKP